MERAPFVNDPSLTWPLQTNREVPVDPIRRVFLWVYFSPRKCAQAGVERRKVLAALGNISRHLTSMLTTKMRFNSNLANYPRPPLGGGGSIFSFAPTGRVLILPGCEPMVQGTWVGERSGTLEDRMLRAPRLVQCLSILRMLPGWGFLGP